MSIDSEKMYSLWQAPIMAFWSRKFFKDVYKNWRGIGFLYISLLSLFIAVCVGIYLQGQAKLFDDAKIQSIVNQVPNIVVNQGTLSSDVKQPYVVTFDSAPSANLVLDTTGAVTVLPDDAVVLITKHRIIMRKRVNGSVLQIYDLDDIDYLEFKRDQLTPLLQMLRDYLPAGLAVLTFIFILMSYLLKVLFYSVAVMLFTKSRYSFKSVFRLSTMALTAGFILDYGLRFLIELPWSLIFLVNIGYVVFAFKSIEEKLDDVDAVEIEEPSSLCENEKLGL